MRRFFWFLCMFYLGVGMFFAGKTVQALPEQVSSIAPDRAEIAVRGAGQSPIPGGIPLEAKTVSLPRIRSLFYEARQARTLIDKLDEAFDCEPVETTVRHGEIAAPPRSQGSLRPDLDGLLRGILLQRALETSA